MHKQTAKWYDIKALATSEGATSSEIFIYGNIGDKWDDNGVVAADFVKDISALDTETITLRINSYGGSVTDGIAIYNALKRNKATVNVHIDGVAMSMASYIAMAGDTITIAENAQVMIHAPWGYSVGNASALREQADILDRYAHAMSDAYAKKSGKPIADILALLQDGKDHYFSAQEAKDNGFADAIGDRQDIAASLVNSFNLSRFLSPVASATFSQKENNMPEATKAEATKARTKQDNAQIVAMFKPFAGYDEIQALQTEVLTDPEMSIETIQAKLLAAIGKGSESLTPQGSSARIETVEDETDKIKTAVTQALMSRAGIAKADTSSNPYRGKKLLDIAKASLERRGIKTDTMDQMQIVAAAFTQSTSDFPVLLENTMHKTLKNAYTNAALTWNRFCATGSVSDFRAHYRYRTGSFGSLDAVNELGEFINKTIPDGEKASVTASTKGNIINISRQAIINDDLGAFVGLSNSLGRAAARTIEVDVYALLALNSGLGPTMADTYTLFHANHSNITTSAAISMAAIDLDRVGMASQLDVSGNDYLDLRPAVLVVPIALGGTARSINTSVYDPDTANKLQKPNIVNGLFSDIVDTPRMTGNRRYLFADAMEAPVIEVAFLDGKSEPYLESQNGFDVDGARYKVRLDYGIAAVDYRGAITNAGG